MPDPVDAIGGCCCAGDWRCWMMTSLTSAHNTTGGERNVQHPAVLHTDAPQLRNLLGLVFDLSLQCVHKTLRGHERGRRRAKGTFRAPQPHTCHHAAHDGRAVRALMEINQAHAGTATAAAAAAAAAACAWA